MLPSPTITALSIARLDVGHHLGLRRALPIGAARLTGRVEDGRVSFQFESFVLQPSYSPDDLLIWLDQQLATDDATIAGYQLSNDIRLLDALPGAKWSPAIRSLAGCGTQSVLDLSARSSDNEQIPFEQACDHSKIVRSHIDPAERFTAWCRSDTDRIAHDTEVDALATWRLIMHRIAGSNAQLARKIVLALNAHFTVWLRNAPQHAARIHAADLKATAA